MVLQQGLRPVDVGQDGIEQAGALSWELSEFYGTDDAGWAAVERLCETDIDGMVDAAIDAVADWRNRMKTAPGDATDFPESSL